MSERYWTTHLHAAPLSGLTVPLGAAEAAVVGVLADDFKGPGGLYAPDVWLSLQSWQRLGFDTGWLDGIFGPDTERAVRDFQHNQGLTADGVVGRETVAAFERLAGRSSGDKTVAEVRDVERMRDHTGVTGQRIVIGEAGGLPAIVDALARRLRLDGAEVVTLHQPDLSDQARAANAWNGSAYVGLTLADEGQQISYFEIDGFTSHGGRALAHACAVALQAVLETEVATQGMRLPVLRETRMPAVWCRLGPAPLVVERAAAVTDALRDAITAWSTITSDDEPSSTG